MAILRADKMCCSCSEPNTFLFFPSSHSITIPELMKTASVRLHLAESSSSSAPSGKHLSLGHAQSLSSHSCSFFCTSCVAVQRSSARRPVSRVRYVSQRCALLACSLLVVHAGFNIIVVDGTWTQAKKVARSLPDSIPYVRLMSTGELAFKAPMRTQSEPDRICTLGAIIQLLSVRVQP